MSNIVISKSETEKRLLPNQSRYNTSLFGNIISLVGFTLIFLTIVIGIWSLLTTYLAIKDFIKVANQGFPEKPLDSNGNPIVYMFWVRWSAGGYFMIMLIYFPTRWLLRTYGRQSIELTDQGIFTSKFPKFKTFSPWDSVLDITVKKSESIFSVFRRNLTKITIYSMDKAITIESIALSNDIELAAKLKAFGDSLDERVIDFGYGATISIVWRRIKRSKVGVLGAFIVAFFVMISIFASAITVVVPHDTLEAQVREKTLFGLWNPVYGAGNPDAYNQPPWWAAPNRDEVIELSGYHIFGTNGSGQDIFSRLLFGAFYSILIGVISTFISTIMGFFIGAASGYIGGTTDQIVQRVTEVIQAMPGLPLLLLISGIFYQVFQNKVSIDGAYYLVVYTVFAFISWAGTARIIRAEVLSLKNSEFIHAERVLGATHFRIITRHIMPNSMSTAIIFFTLGISGAISGVAALAYLGFGSANTLVWGQDLATSVRNNPTQIWWGTTFISLSLFVLVLGFNLLGDALRDALDPKLKN